MAVRRLNPEQPEAFELTPENLAWAKDQIAKYPEGRQASAVIPILWRAQEQNDGWLPEPAMRYVADMLAMPYIRVLEVATFYTMFQLSPVGKKAHIQVCGTTPCMLRGSEDLIKVCKSRIAANPHQVSADGDFSWEEVECLGACSNAPMVQIWKDVYEDLTPESFEKLLDDVAAGREVVPGPENGRRFAMPEGGQTSLTNVEDDTVGYPPVGHVVNGSAAASTVVAGSAINGGEVVSIGRRPAAKVSPGGPGTLDPDSARKVQVTKSDAAVDPSLGETPKDTGRPPVLSAPRDGKGDDLKRIKGLGPKIEKILNDLGVYHFDQIAAWTEADRAWVDANLKFRGRIERENWVEQAKVLAEGGDTDFSRRVDAGNVPTSKG